jgi:predicted nucleic acid-binding protein
MRALLDTNVLFAAASARDRYHDRASAIVSGIDGGGLPGAVVTDYVVAETMNLTRERLGSGVATDLLDRLTEGAHFEVVHTAQADFTAAKALFRTYPGVSFVDATLAAFADRQGVEVCYSFDDDLDVVPGLARLDTATDPRSGAE